MGIDILAVVWISAAVVFGIAEAITMGLTTIWFAGGAVAAAVSAMFTDSILIQVIVFIVVSSVLLAATRPLVKKHINSRTEKTNIEALAGMAAVAVSDIDPVSGGEVKADGKVWRASCDVFVPEGEIVKVEDVKGVTLIISREGD